jgi:DNA modification methylase
MPRSPGKIFADGNRNAAEALVAALRAPSVDHEVAESLTHPFHSYPARVHPATARILVDVVGYHAGKGAAILDPFCGSGTALVEARAAGLRAIGIDLNPLAILVTRAKTWTPSPRRRKELRDVGHTIAGAVLASGKAARRSGAEPMPQRKPVGFDPNARNRRLASWFAPHVRRELELLAYHLDQLRERDIELADVLTACLSAIVYKVSSRTSDTNDTWVARNIARGAAARHFAMRVDLLVAGINDLSRGSGPPTELFEMDARRMADVIPDGSVAGIVTSPPYAGVYDYAEHQRLRFDFLGLRHRDLDAGEIGSRRSFASSPDATVNWRRALAATLDAITRALAPGAAAAIMIGDSVALNVPFYALDDIRSSLTDDLVIEAWASQERPMLGGIEKRAFAERPKAEHVVLLRRR